MDHKNILGLSNSDNIPLYFYDEIQRHPHPFIDQKLPNEEILEVISKEYRRTCAKNLIVGTPINNDII